MPTHVKNRAKAKKNDEWYTYEEDIAKELSNYLPYIRGKRVICPADHPDRSMFYKHLKDNFARYGLKTLTATFYDPNGKAYATVYDGHKEFQARLIGNGDILSGEIRGIIRANDLVITNPPFSLIKKWMDYMIPDGIRFLIVAPNDAICYTPVFPQSMIGKVRWGYNKIKSFGNATTKLGMVGWITNLPVRDKSPLSLTVRYTPANYEKLIDPKGHGAIFIKRLKDIPMDYPGPMAIPITLMEQIDYRQFKVLGIDHCPRTPTTPPGKCKYKRVIAIRR